MRCVQFVMLVFLSDLMFFNMCNGWIFHFCVLAHVFNCKGNNAREQDLGTRGTGTPAKAGGGDINKDLI